MVSFLSLVHSLGSGRVVADTEITPVLRFRGYFCIDGNCPGIAVRTRSRISSERLAYNRRQATSMSFLSVDLAHAVVDDSLPWDRSIKLHIDAFLQRYTLHDSYWIALHTNCGLDDTAVAAISFDPVWKPSVSSPTSHVANWPLLFIRFNCVNTIRMAGFRDIGGTQRGISSVAVDHLSEEESVYADAHLASRLER